MKFAVFLKENEKMLDKKPKKRFLTNDEWFKRLWESRGAVTDDYEREWF